MPDEPPRVLVDTNVWVSALLNSQGAPARVLDAFREGRFVPVVCQELLQEIEAVLARPRIRRRYRVSRDQVRVILALLRDRAVEVFPIGSFKPCRDPDDDLLLETAILGRAQYVVSRDDDIKRDLDLIEQMKRCRVEVLSVAQFLQLLSADRPEPFAP